MTMTDTETAARHLVGARLARKPGPRLPESCRPADCEAALAIQRRVRELLGVAIAGWKCSVPTPERQIAAAPIYAPTITSVSPCAVLGDGKVARIEPEIAFVLGRDLPRRDRPYSDAEARAAISETRPVLELIGTRYADPASISYPELLADCIANQGLFVGPVVSGGLDRPLAAFRITIINGPEATVLTHDGKHPDGHPLRPFVWLANFLAAGGYPGSEGLKAGQVVTTGSYAGILEVPIAVPLSIGYGDLGELSVQFVAAK